MSATEMLSLASSVPTNSANSVQSTESSEIKSDQSSSFGDKLKASCEAVRKTEKQQTSSKTGKANNDKSKTKAGASKVSTQEVKQEKAEVKAENRLDGNDVALLSLVPNPLIVVSSESNTETEAANDIRPVELSASPAAAIEVAVPIDAVQEDVPSKSSASTELSFPVPAGSANPEVVKKAAQTESEIPVIKYQGNNVEHPKLDSIRTPDETTAASTQTVAESKQTKINTSQLVAVESQRTQWIAREGKAETPQIVQPAQTNTQQIPEIEKVNSEPKAQNQSLAYKLINQAFESRQTPTQSDTQSSEDPSKSLLETEPVTASKTVETEPPVSYEQVDLKLQTVKAIVPNASTKVNALNNPEQLVDQVVKGIETITKNNQTNITLKLEPEFLGKLHINLEVRDDVVVATFSTENQQVKHLLETGMGSLRNLLETSGIRLEKAEVNANLSQNANGFQDGNAFSQNAQQDPNKERYYQEHYGPFMAGAEMDTMETEDRFMPFVASGEANVNYLV